MSIGACVAARKWRAARLNGRGITQDEEQLSFQNVGSVTLSPNFAVDQTLFIGEFGYKTNGGLKISTDGGHTWRTSDAGQTWQRASSVKMLHLAAREWCEGDRCGVLLVGGQDFGERVGIYKSFDLGRTWQCPDAPTPDWWPNVPRVFWSFAPLIAQ